MAVSRADKETEFGELQAAFREAETAVLVDYRGHHRAAGDRAAAADSGRGRAPIAW